ncbi:histidine--tRNA ligase [Candidatus Endobugula sertula]|uniref:Histidine--tRNA ligase n=1 Tax=Candidatus Endobugula sertula TaxID=62101 RepID=A0A1D2QLQ1_9GAMM|nr:histidine--tRNA ligase [Candidatus Endobugula sertula]
MSKIQAIRGMNDLLPDVSPVWQYLEFVVAKILKQYGYQEIRFPMVENTDLFKRSIGEVTDIVEKEMYTFADRNNESITLRPEGTASCVRACEQHGLLYNQTQKLWYSGPMFRYEKPQKGRLRQFHQVGVEAFGFSGPDIDAELLLLTARLWKALGLDKAVVLQINSLGTVQSRAAYKQALVNYLTPIREQLDEDSQRRLDSNPLRILDSKSSATQQLLHNAPQLHDYLESESKAHFSQLMSILDASGVSYQVNPHLVRGLDYYGDTVFEWVTDKLGAQGTVCAGGRYNGLIEQLGGKPTPAVGFAMGIERLVLLLDTVNVIPSDIQATTDIYLVSVGNIASFVLQTAETLRSELSHLQIVTHCGGGSFKKQMKKADKSGASIALIIGEDEAARQQVTIKYLREEKAQQTVGVETLIPFIKQVLAIPENN